MKTLIARFRISAALDRDRQPGPVPITQPAAPPAIRQFEAAMRELDNRLRTSRPNTQTPAGLHASVMRAVRAAARQPHAEPAGPALRLATGLACALSLVALVWWFAGRPAQPGNRPNAPTSLAAAAHVLEDGSRWTTLAPGAAVTPLAREWDMVQRDVRGAVEFLMASVP